MLTGKINEFFQHDDDRYVFSTYLYSRSLSLLYFTVYADGEMFYIGFGPTIYHSGVMRWKGRKFYEASKTELKELADRNPHLSNNYFEAGSGSDYKLYVFPSQTDNVLVVAAGGSIMRDEPDVWVKFGGIGE